MSCQIDFIKASLYCHDEPDLSSLHKINSRAGNISYLCATQNSPKITYNQNSKLLIIMGSIMFLYQGHNFSFNMNAFVKAINALCLRLKVNFWNAIVEEFEFAAIMEVDRSPREFIQGHPDGLNLDTFCNPKNRDFLRCFSDKNTRLKLYDVGHRIKTTTRKANREAVIQAGWNPEKYYLKFEAHYCNPCKIFNKGRDMLLSVLVDPDRLMQFKENLMEQYKRLRPLRALVMPTIKKNLGAGEITLFELAEEHLNSGLSLEITKRKLYKRINTYSDNLLSSSDKDSRKRTIKGWIDKLKLEEKSPFDLSEQLAEVLALEGQ